MKITIVTAAYRAKHMPRVWESIAKQTYQDWEWIIVNDGQDEIREWCKQFVDTHLIPDVYFADVQWRKGRFGLFTRNVGAMLANTNNIIFLDDDNEWEPDHLESLVNAKKETDRIPFCWMHIKGKKPGSTHERIKKTGFHKQGIDLGCILWNKRLFEKYGYFLDDAQVTFDWNLIKKVYDGEGEDAFISTKNPSLIFWHKRY